jgi:hypothetical protein
MGKLVKADAVFAAWTSKDIGVMIAALHTPTTSIDRHFLLQTLVGETFRLRDDPSMRALCREVAETHLREFPTIVDNLTMDFGILPRVTTFQNFATLLLEDGEYDRSIDVCRIALQFGLEDGTKGGFEARIARIEKKKRLLAQPPT